MTETKIVKTIKGKYTGTCPECNLVRGDWESKGMDCGRCGHTFQTEAHALTLEGDVKETTDEYDSEIVSKD